MNRTIKSVILALTAMLAFAFSVVADTNAVTSASPYRGGEFAISTYGLYQTSGTVSEDGSEWGVGIQADVFITKHLGIHVATAKNQYGEGPVFQNVAFGPVLRLPIGDTPFAPYILGGLGFDFDNDNERFYYAGAGIEYRPYCILKHVSVFSDVQYHWRDYIQTGDADAIFVRAGLRWTF